MKLVQVNSTILRSLLLSTALGTLLSGCHPAPLTWATGLEAEVQGTGWMVSPEETSRNTLDLDRNTQAQTSPLPLSCPSPSISNRAHPHF
jgi:hypothetical protein